MRSGGGRLSTFLIIDDEPPVAATLARMLAVAGHEAASVHSAEAGLEAARRALPDALLVDLRMPVVSGLEFLRRLRQDAQLREVPVAMVTGDYFLEDGILAEITALGATVRYKPLWLEDIVALAKALTEGSPDTAGP